MRYILLILCSLFSSLLLADNVTVEQAQSLALSFLRTNAQTRGTSPQVRLVWNGEDASTRTTEEPAFYVFNRTDDSGFIIVSGDDIAMPVLGYSFKNNFKAEAMPPNLKEWLAELRRQINDARRKNVTASARTAQYWKNASASIGNVEVQLETAQWNQDAPYNYYCPIINSKRAVTGCVATAMAIVLRYYQWPDKGVGILPEYNYERNGVTRTQEGHALGHSYNWNLMPLEYKNGSYSTEEKKAVATLMFDCGVMVQATYTSEETGAYTRDAVKGLTTYMKYSKNVRELYRDWYADTKWISMLRQEIRTNGPVLYGGSTIERSGHQFVLDGYTSKNYFGVNWGWGGYSNGYFLISALDPYETGIGGGSGGGYLYNQSAVFGLKKAEDDPEVKDFIMIGPGTDSQTGQEYNGLSTNETVFQTGRNFYVTAAYVWNVGATTFNGDVVFSLVDEEGNIKENISNIKSLTNIESRWGYAFSERCIITGTISEGDRIWLRYRSANTPDWQRVLGQEGTVSEIIVKSGDGKSLSESTSFSYNKVNKVILLKTKKSVTYKVLSATGASVKSGTADSNNEIRISTEAFAAGAYTLVLEKGDSRKELTFVIGKQK